MAEFAGLALAERLAEVVRIPSVNPMQAGPTSGTGGEHAMSTWLADQCDGRGADVVVDEVLDGRCNVYATFPGATDRVVTVDAHLDTVGVEHMTGDPFSGEIADDRVFGRGSVDTKASFAVVLAVLDDMRTAGDGLQPTVNLVGTVAEEAGGLLGANRYRDWLLAQSRRVHRLIVAEPTMCAPVHGHKGGLGLEVDIHGHAAHSSKPHLGQNAIHAAARVILALTAEHDRLQEQPTATPVGSGTVSVTEIGGGLARNIIPDSCHLYAGRRTVPHEDPETVRDALTELIVKAADPLSVDVRVANNGFMSAAFYQDPDSELVRLLAQLGESVPDVAAYGSNALRYAEVADEMVVFGPGSIDQAHQAVEWIDVSELVRAASVYRQLFTRTELPH